MIMDTKEKNKYVFVSTQPLGMVNYRKSNKYLKEYHSSQN